MSVLPKKRSEMIAWFAARMDAWNTDPAGIGLTPEQAANLSTALSDAQDKQAAATEARNASKDATVQENAAANALRGLGSQLVQTVRAFAKQSDEPAAVYAAASVPPPAPPRPLPAPQAPQSMAFRLTSGGAVELTWQADTVHNVVFVVKRRVEDPDGTLGAWATVTTVGGTRTVTDTQIPAGTHAVLYQVRAIRSGKQSDWSDPVAVRFTAESGQASELKLAA